VTDNFSKIIKILIFLNIPISYAVMRIILIYIIPKEFIATISVLIMMLSTVIIVFLLLKIKTNKLKTTSKMKDLRVEDGPARNIGKRKS
jgi:hypothetical protein